MKALTRPEVSAKTGLRKSALYAAIARGDFPAPAKAGPRRSIWSEAEVDAWLKSRFDARAAVHGGAQ